MSKQLNAFLYDTPAEFFKKNRTELCKSIAGCTAGGSSSGVTSFNGRPGDVILTSSDVTTALGYTPINKTFVNSALIAATDSSGNIIDGTANVISRTLVGFTVGANSTIVVGDTILGAFGKTQGQLNNKAALVHTHAPTAIINPASGAYVVGRLTSLAGDPSLAIALTTTNIAGSIPVRDAFSRYQAGDPLNPTDVVNLQTLQAASEALRQDIVVHTTMINGGSYVIPTTVNAVIFDSFTGPVTGFTITMPSGLTSYKRVILYFTANVTGLVLNPGLDEGGDPNTILSARTSALIGDCDEYGYDYNSITWELVNRYPEKITLQQSTTSGNVSSNEILITGNSLLNTNKGFHISFDSTLAKTSLTNINTNGNTNTTSISMDLHNLEFFTQGGFRVLGLNDQQSGGQAAANFNGRVKIEDAFLDNEAASWSQVKNAAGTNKTTKGIVTFTADDTTTILNIAHGLGAVPTWYEAFNLTGLSGNYSGREITVDGTNIIITFASAPTTSDGNAKFAWKAEL